MLKNGFDAKECDLKNCAPPFPTPILQNIVKCLKMREKTQTRTESMECGRSHSDMLEKSAKFVWSRAALVARLGNF